MDEFCILQTEALTQKERRKHQPGLVATRLERHVSDCHKYELYTIIWLSIMSFEQMQPSLQPKLEFQTDLYNSYMFNIPTLIANMHSAVCVRT